MITLRVGTEDVLLEPEEWRRWVEDGRVPPDAWVLFPGDSWIRAGSHPSYRSLVSPGPTRRTLPGTTLRDILFPRRGVSATEALLLINLLTAGILVAWLGAGYLPAVREWTTGWWYAVRGEGAGWWWIPTIFLHAGARHLGYNMVALLITAGTTEFLAGRLWTYLLYGITGVAGMALSYWGHDHPPLSIGASGAIYGLAGAAIAMVLRRRSLFSYRQRWKAWRVYLPLFVALALPSLLHADYWGHTGGLVCGLLVGPFVPPHRRLRDLAALEDSLTTSE